MSISNSFCKSSKNLNRPQQVNLREKNLKNHCICLNHSQQPYQGSIGCRIRTSTCLGLISWSSTRQSQTCHISTKKVSRWMSQRTEKTYRRFCFLLTGGVKRSKSAGNNILTRVALCRIIDLILITTGA